MTNGVTLAAAELSRFCVSYPMKPSSGQPLTAYSRDPGQLDDSLLLYHLPGLAGYKAGQGSEPQPQADCPQSSRESSLGPPSSYLTLTHFS